MTFVSYAQNFEDVLLWRVFRTVSEGFYIDVGASHPDTDSVTRAFYDRSWRGINVEPVPELHGRLCAARPRDINLRVAAGRHAGPGTVYVVAGTGLSTVDAALAERHRADEYDVRAQDVPVTTLAAICREHAPETVHFLKIDAEGAEAAVLEGADFAACRPWIVLVEATAPGTTIATHADWEDRLVDAGYRFLYFDGLNRFYAASEHFDAVSPHFRVPVCVFDDFVRAADSEWTRRISHAEMQAADLRERILAADDARAGAEHRARDAEMRARRAEDQILPWVKRADSADARTRQMELRLHEAEAGLRQAEARLQQAEAMLPQAEARLQQTEARLQQTEARLLTAEARLAAQANEAQRQLAALRSAQEDAASLRASTSWRLTAPVRHASILARVLTSKGRVAANAAKASLAVRQPVAALPDESGLGAVQPARPRARVPVKPRVVHQFHAGSAYGDAITNAMLMIRAQLRAMGYRSEIYVAHRDAALLDELLVLDDLPSHDGYVLLLHHSMGFDCYDRVVALPVAKILIYHNITPAEMFAGQPDVQRYIHLGREQLAGLRDKVCAALADSEYNTIELHRMGFADPHACTLLFDLEVMRRQFGGRRRRSASEPFTVLFVGRVVPSKGQLDLVRAFGRFRGMVERPSRLVLVGREDGAGQDYARAVREEIRALGLEASVLLTGLVTDEELRAQYRAADLYVSLSRHEGFGVPIVEAAVAGVPVLAWPAGAVAFTLGDETGVLRSREPEQVAGRMAALARDGEARLALGRAQRAALTRFELPAQLGRLTQALVHAGAAPPPDPVVQRRLRENMRFTIAGHVTGSYSLAAINRTMALVLEEARPGSVLVLPVEGQPVAPQDGEASAFGALTSRPAHETGPVVVISQHYPVYVPADGGDALLAYVFWEESRLPAATVSVLNASFNGVLAPSRFVARALIDSGVSVPVRVVGFAPDLAAFEALARPARPAGAEFVFLHVSSAFPRKGVDVLLAAYAKAFRADDHVRLVIKSFPNPHNDVAARIAALAGADMPAIELIDRDMALDELAALYGQADAMVLPARGEGFNLPAAEAMAAGLPLIVTGHGGHMDFCGPDNARLVDFRLAASGSHVAPPLSLWAEPDVDDLAAALREAYRGAPEVAARAARAREGIGPAMSRANFVRRVEEAALRAVTRPPARPLRLCVVSSWNVRCGIAEYTRFLLDAIGRADASIEISVLSDTRPVIGPETGIAARPAWALGSARAAASLQQAVSVDDPDIVLIQHQPGLLDWVSLGCLLSSLAAPHLVLAVTLHNTAHLLEVEDEDRESALEGLRVASRLLVHSLADVERLRGLGLVDNVVLIPHGAPDVVRTNHVRSLTGNDTVTIGSYGFLLRDKGIPHLIEAAGLLKARWPKIRLCLLHADYGGEESKATLAACREAVVASALDGAVELVTDFLPFETSRARLAACDVIALPYQRSKEGASGALRVALSTGTCVAVSPLRVFDDAEDAVYRLPGLAASDIAEGLACLLGDRDLRARTSHAARQWTMERHWDAVASRTLGMLRGLSVSEREA